MGRAVIAARALQYNIRVVMSGRWASRVAHVGCARGRRWRTRSGRLSRPFCHDSTEYEEQFDLSLDGSATGYVNASVPALVALRGIELDTRPDGAARSRGSAAVLLRQRRAGDAHQHRRGAHGRRFVQLRMDMDDVRKLANRRRSHGRRSASARRAISIVYMQRVGRLRRAATWANVGWNGTEIVAFRLHLPARIRFHNAPSQRVDRGNILEWEQPLADRLKGVPIRDGSRGWIRSRFSIDADAVRRDGGAGAGRIRADHLDGGAGGTDRRAG